jgi:hypothetical protein
MDEAAAQPSNRPSPFNPLNLFNPFNLFNPSNPLNPFNPLHRYRPNTGRSRAPTTVPPSAAANQM